MTPTSSEAFVHPQALCESPHVGRGTRVWAFAHVLPGALVGEDCNICDGVFVENDVVIGDRVTVKCGVQLWDGVRLESDVFVGPNATFTNDPFPRSRQHLREHPETTVERGASIGANATVLPGVRIGRGAMVGAGAVVTRNVPPFAVVVGNPARVVRYVDAEAPGPARPAVPPAPADQLGVGEAFLAALPGFGDARGDLAVVEFADHVPFEVRRTFFVHGVPSSEVRGEHAHRECHQFLVCTHGSVSVVVDDGHNRAEAVLDRPTVGLYVPPMVWASEYRFTSDAVLTVFASHPYDPDDYLRTYDDFLAALGSHGDQPGGAGGAG